jgi:hypothetical protein
VSWSLVAVSEALAATLSAALNPDSVTVFASPPTTLNPPAVVVSYPAPVVFGTRALGVDTAAIPVICAVGLTAPLSSLDALLESTRAALDADRKLGGAVKSCLVTELVDIRSASIAGIDLLAGYLSVSVEN